MDTLERALIEKAACENGWEHVPHSSPAAVVLASARHRGRAEILANSAGSGWLVVLDSSALAQEVARSFSTSPKNGGKFAVQDIDTLAALLRRAAALAQSLPHQAARDYQATVAQTMTDTPPSATEIERVVRQRIGQDIFRRALLDYWGGACAVTGIVLPELLRASHAKPWAMCDSDEERLDVFNGLLLCANLDALFDRGLISFAEDGKMLCANRLPPDLRHQLGLAGSPALRWLAGAHRPYLRWHQENIFAVG